jgi:hypothetical protein
MAAGGEDQGARGRTARWRSTGWRVLAAVAIAAQATLLLAYFGMGLGWAGVWWYLTLLQAAVGVVVAGVALGKPAAALLVPPVSFGLTLVFVGLDRAVAAWVCSPGVTSAADELGPVPGFTQRPEYQPEIGKGCAARFNSPRPPAEVIERYRSAGVGHGWTLAAPQPANRAVLRRGDLTLEVWENRWDDRGMYLMSIRRT